ncbi:hypothetical protein ACF1BN_22700 [Streptomyces sp. NPDC014861]|uniref:hypothetical protein n=1 Tax=Streptomyces sp. NPDC014861 TaxID=3364923 RepID=UPI0036FF3B8D
MEDPFDVGEDGVARGLSGLLGELGGGTDERGDQPVLLPARLPQPVAVERPVGLAQGLAQREEALGLLGPFPGQQVRRPDTERRPAQRGDRLRRGRVVGPPRLGRLRVPGRREIGRPQPVQRAGDLVDIHPPTLLRRAGRAGANLRRTAARHPHGRAERRTEAPAPVTLPRAAPSVQ